MTCALRTQPRRLARGRPAAALPDPDQLTRRRWDDWRRDRDERGRSAVLIAALYGVDPQSVRSGIRRARALRAEVARACAD